MARKFKMARLTREQQARLGRAMVDVYEDSDPWIQEWKPLGTYPTEEQRYISGNVLDEEGMPLWERLAPGTRSNPRLDTAGQEWYACDPYPTWFILGECQETPSHLIDWADGYAAWYEGAPRPLACPDCGADQVESSAGGVRCAESCGWWYCA